MKPRVHQTLGRPALELLFSFHRNQPLHAAAEKGDLEKVKEVIGENSASLNEQDEFVSQYVILRIPDSPAAGEGSAGKNHGEGGVV